MNRPLIPRRPGYRRVFLFHLPRGVGATCFAAALLCGACKARSPISRPSQIDATDMLILEERRLILPEDEDARQRLNWFEFTAGFDDFSANKGMFSPAEGATASRYDLEWEEFRDLVITDGNNRQPQLRCFDLTLHMRLVRKDRGDNRPTSNALPPSTETHCGPDRGDPREVRFQYRLDTTGEPDLIRNMLAITQFGGWVGPRTLTKADVNGQMKPKFRIAQIAQIALDDGREFFGIGRGGAVDPATYGSSPFANTPTDQDKDRVSDLGYGSSKQITPTGLMPGTLVAIPASPGVYFGTRLGIWLGTTRDDDNLYRPVPLARVVCMDPRLNPTIKMNNGLSLLRTLILGDKLKVSGHEHDLEVEVTQIEVKEREPVQWDTDATCFDDPQ